MSNGYGMGGHLGFCFQQSFDTAYNTGQKFFPLITESLTESIPPLVQAGMTGTYHEGQSFEGPHDIAGDTVCDAHPSLIGYLLKGVCGQSSSTVVTSYYYSHIFQPRLADFDDFSALPPATIEVYRDAGSAFQYYNCNVNKLQIEWAYGQLVKSTASLIGGKFATAAKATATYEPFSEWTWDQTSVSLAGTGIDEVESLTVAITANVAAKGTLNSSKYPNRIKRTAPYSIEISGTILFTSQTEVDNFRNQTQQILIITTKQNSHQLEVSIPSFRYLTFPVNIGGTGQIGVGFTGSAKYNAGSEHAIKFTLLVTSQSSY